MTQRLTIDIVQRALQRPLPGLPAQMRMGVTPRPGKGARGHGPEIRPPRQAAVLALLFPGQSSLVVPLTRRTERVTTHKGQIAFPGGAIEPEDGGAWRAAVREAYEEVGIDPSAVRPLGRLSPLYIPASHYCVQPFVAHVTYRPVFSAYAEEVADLIELPLDVLLDDDAKREEVWDWQGTPIRVRYYAYAGETIWGATAMMLSELEVLVRAEIEEGS